MMHITIFTMNDLFLQLGLDTDDNGIADFVRYHHLNHYQKLSEAEFWNPAQARFICESWQKDAEWAQLIDQLDVLLRH
jgi:hypothetical protein